MTKQQGFSATASRIFGSVFGRKNGKAVVAIDVAPNAIRALHVRKDAGQLVLDGYRLIRGVGDARTLSGGMREALELRVSNEPVVISIASPEVTVRRIEVPPMSPLEFREALPWEARRHIAGLADDAVLDAQILANGAAQEDGGSARGSMSAVLVSFPRDLYDGLASAVADFDVEPEFVDVSPLSAMNALLQYRANFENGPIALLDLSSPLGWFSIFSANDLILFRDLSQRVAEIDQALAGGLGIDAQALDTLRQSGKLPKGEQANAAVVQRALAPVIAELVEDLRAALLYLESRSGGSLERVHLTGSQAPLFERFGIAELVSAQSGVALERWNPLQGFRIGLVDEIGLRAAAGELSSAAGLVARYVQGA